MAKACFELKNGEILNATHLEYPLFDITIHGGKLECAKLSKRVVCALRQLPLRLSIKYEHNTQISADMGVRFDPTLTLGGSIFIEGLISAEEISVKFQNLLMEESV